jgi:cytidine deaminase
MVWFLYIVISMWCPGAPATANASLPWIMSASDAQALSRMWNCPSEDALARQLVPWALAKHPNCGGHSCFTPLSDFRCHAVLTGASGAIYLGINLEVPAVSESTTLHAEQFASLLSAGVGHSRITGRLRETGLVSLAQRGTGAPCGHCRQWLAEFIDAPSLVLLGTSDITQRRPMNQIFPMPFGPSALNNSCPLLSSAPECARPLTDMGGARGAPIEGSLDPLSAAAVHTALHESYCPYTRRRSAVALRTARGAIFTGGAYESVALNPSVQPVVAALVDLIVGGGAALGRSWGRPIVEAVLAEESESESESESTGPEPHAHTNGDAGESRKKELGGTRVWVRTAISVGASGVAPPTSGHSARGLGTPAAAWPSYEAHTRAVVEALAPNATFRVVRFS